MSMDAEAFGSWMEHPCTEAFVQWIKNNIQARRDIVSGGGCLMGDGFEKIGQSYFAQMNTLTVYENLLNDLTYETLFPKEESEDGESQEDFGGSYPDPA